MRKNGDEKVSESKTEIKKDVKNRKVVIKLPNNSTVTVDKGIMLGDLYKLVNFKSPYPALVGVVNNKLADFNKQIFKDSRVEFLDLTTPDGKLCYQRSLSFLLVSAVNELFKDARIQIKHSLNKGFYCEIEFNPPRPLTQKDVKLLEGKMREWVAKDFPFRRKEMDIVGAIEFFEKQGQIDKARLLKYRLLENDKKVSIYECNGFRNHFYGYLVPSTGYLKVFELRFYPPGFLLRFPRGSNPDILPDFIEHVKLFTIFKEYSDWGKILGVRSVADLNDIIESNDIDEFILIVESLHEKKLAEIADKIKSRIVKPKLILISGPSSSGKTTFLKRLTIQLKINDIHPLSVSLDNYFVDRVHTPKDELGEYDFEALEAIDAKLFEQHIFSLLNGEEVNIPKYDFKTGTRKPGPAIKMGENQVIIVEGIHGLNRSLTENIPEAIKYKIYVSALTMLNLDYHNRISTTDTRLIRRIVRDNFFRGYSANDTLSRWQKVGKGEDKYIFPYQERADVMFNSSLVYELAVLKKYAEPLLEKISSNSNIYSEATRLKKFLSHFKVINPHIVPKTSILREFIGGSGFNY